MTITEFLLARIAEDKAVARKAVGEYRSAQWHLGEHDETVLMYPPSSAEKIEAAREEFGDALANEHSRWSGQVIEIAGDQVAPHIVRHNPARVLAECEAKRRIVVLHQMHGPGAGACDICTSLDYVGMVDEGPCETLLILASVYVDHPDFDPAWNV